jgi:hypothetical protein
MIIFVMVPQSACDVLRASCVQQRCQWNFTQRIGCGSVLKVGSSGGGADMASTMMQKFWDSALTLEPPEDDDDSHR